MKIMSTPLWMWKEGEVNPEEEHIKLGYGGFEDKFVPVALVVPEEDNCFIVEVLMTESDRDLEIQEILKQAKSELDFYLVEKHEQDPWAYAIYHCSTASNLYSKVHWSYYP